MVRTLLLEAEARFAESLGIRKKLAQADPTSATQRDLSLSLVKLGYLTGDRGMLREALGIVRELERIGRLVPRDRQLREEIPEILESLP